MSIDDRRRELVRGEVREMAPAGSDHGIIANRIAFHLSQFVYGASIGEVFAAETGFVLSRNPDTVRAPDVSFVRAERTASTGRPAGYWPGPPDLAVEVLSPTDTVELTEEKVDDYLQAGTAEVWIVNPRRKTLTIHRQGVNPVILREHQELISSDLLPGFRLLVGDVFR
jgi:Uma2 family endonuclease